MWPRGTKGMSDRRDKYTIHEIVKAAKDLTVELGKVPTFTVFKKECKLRSIQYNMERLDLTWLKVLDMAGLQPAKSPTTIKEEKGLLRKYVSLCSKREKIEGFYRNVLDLESIFARAGYPKSIKILGQGDTHAKFRDHKAWTCYLKFAKFWNPDVHLIIGDFADCEGLSHWPSSDMEPRRIVPEMKIARSMLEKTVQMTPNCSTRLFLEGNHENWIQQALGRMPEMFDGLGDLDIDISVKTLLALDRYGYQFFPMNELVQIGKAHFTHGIYTAKHHAAKHLDEFKTNIYYGHLHDLQEHNNTSVDGPMEASCIGCLCRLDAKFLKGKKNNWAHCAPCWEMFPDGTYNFYKLRILNGRLIYNGQIFEGDDEPAPAV